MTNWIVKIDQRIVIFKLKSSQNLLIEIWKFQPLFFSKIWLFHIYSVRSIKEKKCNLENRECTFSANVDDCVPCINSQ